MNAVAAKGHQSLSNNPCHPIAAEVFRVSAMAFYWRDGGVDLWNCGDHLEVVALGSEHCCFVVLLLFSFAASDLVPKRQAPRRWMIFLQELVRHSSSEEAGEELPKDSKQSPAIRVFLRILSKELFLHRFHYHYRHPRRWNGSGDSPRCQQQRPLDLLP